MEKTEKIIKCGSAIVGGLVGYLLGGWDVCLSTLITFMCLDFLLGLLCGFATKKLSSQTAFKGINRKVGMFAIVAVACRIDVAIGAGGVLRTSVLFFYIAKEGLSILENSALLGAPVPKIISDTLIQLEKGQKKEVE